MNNTATLVPALPAPPPLPPLPPLPPGSLAPIFSAIANITDKIGSVKKTGTNEFHKYAYATAADVMHALQPLIAQEGLVIIPSEKSRELMADCILAIISGRPKVILKKNFNPIMAVLIEIGEAPRSTIYS